MLLASYFRLTSNDTVNDNHTLDAACFHGHLHCAMWLADHFDVSKRAAPAVRCASEKGHSHVAEWLVKRFNLAAEDAR